MTDLDPHTRLCLNAGQLAYATPDQRATALALTSIAGATSDRGTIGMGLLPQADSVLGLAYAFTSRVMDMDELNAAMEGLRACGFLTIPAVQAGHVYRLDTTTIRERFQCPDDAPVDYSQGIASPTYRIGDA
jgi:hypothetical protein